LIKVSIDLDFSLVSIENLSKMHPSSAGVSKLRPADQMRPAKPFHPAREAILFMMKN